MTFPDSSGRRAFLGATASVAVASVAGCITTTDIERYEQTGPTTHLQIADFRTFTGPLGSASAVEVHLADIKPVRAVVWLGPADTQLGAVGVPYGEPRVELEVSAGPDAVVGENHLVAVSGGELDCFGQRCSHSGGREQARTTFEVSEA